MFKRRGTNRHIPLFITSKQLTFSPYLQVFKILKEQFTFLGSYRFTEMKHSTVFF